jgi:hypothetical protein
MARDAGQDDRARAPGDAVEPRSRARAISASERGQRERRLAQLHRVDAQQQVMHHRVADEDRLDDGAGDPASAPPAAASALIASRTAFGHLGVAAGVHHRIGHAAHQVLAKADLRVHHAAPRRSPRRSTDRTDARRWWSSRDRWPARKAALKKPGQTSSMRPAAAGPPKCSATVTFQLPLRSAGCSFARTGAGRRITRLDLPLRATARGSRSRSPVGRACRALRPRHSNSRVAGSITMARAAAPCAPPACAPGFRAARR